MSDESLSVDAEFEALIQSIRADIQERREREDERLNEVIARFRSRGGPYKPLNLPSIEVRDFKNEQAGDR